MNLPAVSKALMRVAFTAGRTIGVNDSMSGPVAIFEPVHHAADNPSARVLVSALTQAPELVTAQITGDHLVAVGHDMVHMRRIESRMV